LAPPVAKVDELKQYLVKTLGFDKKMEDNRAHLIQVDNQIWKHISQVEFTVFPKNFTELTRIHKCQAAHNLLRPPAMVGLL
jgi:hypothetical protein